MHKFESKVVLVTGSSRGLGRQMAKDFAKNGAQVVVTGRESATVDAVVAECCSLSPCGIEAVGFVADVTKTDQIKNLISNVVEKFGKLDVLINNAGAGAFGSIEDEDILEKFNKMINLNLYSVVTFTHEALPYLKKTKGNIVNITSIVASRPVSLYLF